MIVVCAWCRRPLGGRAEDEPVSHGICAACAGHTGLFPVEELLTMTHDEFDRLPIGIVELDAVGTVRAYNRSEEMLAGFDRSRILGRNFFEDVAPCTRVQQFFGRYRELTLGTGTGEAEFSFVFRFAGGDRLVMIQIAYDPARGRGIIAVKALA